MTGKSFTRLQLLTRLNTRQGLREYVSLMSMLSLFIAVAACCIFYSSDAYATLPGGPCTVTITGASGSTVDVNPICSVFETIQKTMRGTTGKVIATIAVVALGMLALMGKITWQQALVVVLGVGTLFGSAVLINVIAGQSAFSGTSLDTSIDPITSVLKGIVTAMTSEGGRAVGMVAVAILGLGALFGKITWIQGLTLTAGVGLVFGSANIVNQFWDPDITAIPFLAITALTDPVAGAFANVIGLIISPTGPGPMIATVAVMFLGFMAMVGRLSWPRALILATGIALLYGAADVVNILSGPLAPCTATSTDPFTQVICAFMEELQGPMGKTIGTLAIMVVGILSMLGKVSWELGLVVSVGIGLIYGANSIIQLLESLNSHGIQDVSCSSTVPSAPSTGNAIADVLCYIVKILYGPAGKALATVAVIMMGFGALMGKVSYSQAFIVAAGIAVTFGAPDIVKLLLPSASSGATSCIPTDIITSTGLGVFTSATGC